jgi:Glucodextranase, domain B
VRRFAPFLLALLIFAFPRAAFADVWMADGKSLYKLDAAGNHISLSIPSAKSSALAVDASDASVWILSDDRLSKRSSGGTRLFDSDLKSLGLDGASSLAMDAHDGSIWVGRAQRQGHEHWDSGSFIHFDRNGKWIGKLQVPGDDDDDDTELSIALDQSVWILSGRHLLHFSSHGTLLTNSDLRQTISGDPKLFLVDSIGVWLWIAADSRLTRLDAHSPSSHPVSIKLPKDAQALASDETLGTIWILTDAQLLAYDSFAVLKKTIDLKSLGIKDGASLAFDPVSRSVLVGHKAGLTRLSQAGSNPIFIATPDDIGVIGVSSFALQTQLSLTSPPAGALTANALIPIELQLQALCNGAGCGFTGGFFHGYSLSALLNNQDVGALFVIDPISGKATYQPATRLPEGINTLKATATDSFGQASNTVSASFVVDTIAPRFVSVNPPDGFVASSVALGVSGNTDDSGATITFENFAELGAGGVSRSTGSFAFSVSLKPGLNVVHLSAVDAAGNRSTLDLHYTLSSGVTLTVVDPLDGATVQSDLVSVSGSIDPSSGAGVTVNGEPALVIGNRWIADNVALVAGPNALQVIATTKDGAIASRTVTVTSAASAAFKLSALPAQGIAPLIAQVNIQNMSAADIAQIDVDFDGDGVVDVTTTNPNRVLDFSFAAPGIYRPTATVTYVGGQKVVQKTTIVVLSPQQADDIFLPIWKGFSDALKAGDKAKALSFLSVQAQERMGPVFDALMADMTAIMSSCSTPQRVSVVGGIAEYAVNRTIDGADNIFFIYFMQDAAGLWTIDQL